MIQPIFFIYSSGVLLIAVLALWRWCAWRKAKREAGGYPPGTD